jgi:hypothetical protein
MGASICSNAPLTEAEINLFNPFKRTKLTKESNDEIEEKYLNMLGNIVYPIPEIEVKYLKES